MKHTVSLKLNHVFRSLYAKGKSAAAPTLALYCRRNRLGHTRLGFTVSTKLGGAVVRNRVRRRLREAYRTNEGRFLPGYDIVVVGRTRAVRARYGEIERHLLQTADKLGLLQTGEQK